MPIWDWMVQWSAQLINRYLMDEHGYTGMQRIRGKTCRKPLCLFGEFVLWKPSQIRGHELPSMEERFFAGRWFGLNAKSDEDIIGTSRGVVRARTVMHLPSGQRWIRSMLS